MINSELKIEIIEVPYKIWIIDNFLDENVINRIKQSWTQIQEDKWHSGYDVINGKKNILEHGMKAISKIELMPFYLQDILKYFHGDEFTNEISKITGIIDLLPDETMRWSGLRTMLPNSFQLIHSDARKHPNNLLTKELTCLLYLNDDYSKDTHEGCLEIWNDNMTIKTHDIEPINNRMVIFVNSETSFHGVPKVLKERKAITFSIMSKNTSSIRNKALFVSRPEDSEEVKQIGVERAVIFDKNDSTSSIRS
jgi:Rps23 Pro-64 3,4-dihydroxylase Tpa1-like proline 4-hydroxylase